MTAMCNALCERAKAVLCIGPTGPQIAALMAQSASQTSPVYHCGDLATAVNMARGDRHDGRRRPAQPGCASYDQFVNFEKRGEAFARARGA